MIKLTKREDCCGCSTCQQICPKKCLSLIPDNEGFVYPHIDENSCIDCHLCEKVCPVKNQESERSPLKVFAAYNNDQEIRAKSSSGGIFTLIATEVIRQHGIVFGVKFDEKWNAVFDYTTEIYGLEDFRGSKYVQAQLNDTFKNVKAFLDEGKLVLFTGTPCQVAGLRRFLNKEYENLILLDLICEGVPSPKVWQKYLTEEINLQYRNNKGEKSCFPNNITIANLSFRDKTTGWHQFGLAFSLKINSNEKYHYIRVGRDSAYIQALFNNLILRPICYDCPFKKCKSHSDITVADYWGIHVLHPEMDDNKGTSMVYLNTTKGINAFPIKQTSYIETTYEEAFSFNNITTSVEKHPNRDKFYSNIDKCHSIISLLYNNTFPSSYRIKEKSKRCLSNLLSPKTYQTLETIWRKVKK